MTAQANLEASGMGWWVFVAFVVGACVGVILMGVCCANSLNADPNKKRWWEDE